MALNRITLVACSLLATAVCANKGGSAGGGVITTTNSTFEKACLSFDPLAFVVNATVNIHEFVPANTTLEFPGNDPSCNRPSQVSSVDVCRIALNISTSARSGIIFESWLPANWTGRFLATGNGGIDGCIKVDATQYEDINYGTMNGFSAVGSNNGHNGTSGLAFFHNDDVVEDYAYRSLHTITETGKNLTDGFYTSPRQKNYYLGCSGGGRQGMKAAEMFPSDFDGIVIGAPAINFNNMTSWRASMFAKTGGPGSPNFIPLPTWSGLIHTDILRQCDTIDGVADGIIENPKLCDYRPEALLCCPNTNLTVGIQCLSSAQVEIVRSIFSPLTGSSGELVYTALEPGSEIMAVTFLLDGKPFPYSEDWFRYVVYQDPSWDDTMFNLSDITAAQALNPFDVQTFPNDLSEFAFHNSINNNNTNNGGDGGKMIIYHGQQDGQISTFHTERFYNHLARGMSLPSSQIDNFLRFFRISGMWHCSGGPGAWMVGQAASAAVGFEAESNVLAAVLRWVEEGVAPETMEGRKFVGDVVGEGVEVVRRHCRYPFLNTYVGGDASEAGSWECVFR